MHALFPVRKFLLCAIAFEPAKLRVVLKIADQSRAGSHFNSQNTHSQFRNSHFARAPHETQKSDITVITKRLLEYKQYETKFIFGYFGI